MENVIIVTSSVPKFRRAGEGFTDNGVAFPPGHFNDAQMKRLRQERKVSVQEMPLDEVPEGVDISNLAELAPEGADIPEGAEVVKKPAAKRQAAKSIGVQ